MATVFKKRGSGDWQIEYTDHDGRRRRESSRTTDKRKAKEIGALRESEAAERRVRYPDPADALLEREDARPFDEHVADYVAHQRLHARADRHVVQVESYLKGLKAEVGVGRLSDVTRDKVEAYLAKLKAKGATIPRRKDAKGPAPFSALAPRTLNYARNSIASFMAWAVESGR